MESVKIFRQMVIKQVVTAESKESALNQIHQELLQAAEEKKHFDEERNKLLTEASLKGADQQQIAKFRAHFEQQGAHINVKIDELKMRSSEIGEMKIGDEVVLGSVEGPYELSIGDTLDRATSCEIIVKDGVVIEIR